MRTRPSPNRQRAYVMQGDTARSKGPIRISSRFGKTPTLTFRFSSLRKRSARSWSKFFVKLSIQTRSVMPGKSCRKTEVVLHIHGYGVDQAITGLTSSNRYRTVLQSIDMQTCDWPRNHAHGPASQKRQDHAKSPHVVRQLSGLACSSRRDLRFDDMTD